MRKLWWALIAVFFCLQAEAQINRNAIKKNNKKIGSYRGKSNSFGRQKAYSALGVSLNALNYYGDLAPRPSKVSTDISFTKPGIGVSFMHRFGPRYTVLGTFMFGTLRGSDAESADKNDLNNGVYRFKRNLSFRNNIKEFSAVAVLDLFKNDGNYIARVKWTPYAFVGIGMFMHQPKAQAPATDLNGTALPQAGDWVKLRPLGTEGQYSTLEATDANSGIKPYGLLQAAIPFGLGARLRLNEVMDLWADIGFRYTFTDYLDDVSRNYVDLGVLSSELAKSMSYRTNELGLATSNHPYVARNGQTYVVEAGYGEENVSNNRGSKSDRDVYMVTSIRLTYIIGATFHKAKFR
ncbi:MAG TPA: DUF6089 family protein [Cyclobacteriaceae bacterium]|nr:DUF6089 family protein [Cyclobacteriaceae bacterium]